MTEGFSLIESLSPSSHAGMAELLDCCKLLGLYCLLDAYDYTLLMQIAAAAVDVKPFNQVTQDSSCIWLSAE